MADTIKQVGFIGLGIMGMSMARNLMRAGFTVTVHNRSPKKVEEIAKEGARPAQSPKEVAERSQVTITCLPDTPDVRQVLLGPNGVTEGAKPGSYVVDMSTISPKATGEMACQLAGKQVHLLDAPVSGGSEGAQKGTLAIMVGGEPAHFEAVKPVLAAMGKRITLVGPVGSGQMTKAINQTIIAGVYQAVAEGMVLGLKAKLDMDKVIEAIAGGAAGSWVLENRAKRMVENRYPPGFFVRLHRKDLGIILETARELGVALPVAALVHQFQTALIAMGHAEDDTSALMILARQMAGMIA